MTKSKRTKNDLQNITAKTKDGETRTPPTHRCEFNNCIK